MPMSAPQSAPVGVASHAESEAEVDLATPTIGGHIPEKKKHNLPEPEPLLLSVQQVRVMLNCARSTVFELLRKGNLERVKYNRSTRITRRSVLKLAGLSENAPR